MDSVEGVEKWAEAKFVHGINVTSDLVCDNIRRNAGRPLPQVEFKSICICASGPSLADHIDDIRARQEAGFSVASMNGSHNFLIDHGIVPDYYFQIDARTGNLSFLDKANDHTTYVVGSQCQPEIFEALEGRKVEIWQVDNYEGAAAAIREQAPRATIFGGAYNVGQSCLGPILAKGYRIWHLFGYDGSMRGDDKHAFTQKQNLDEEVREFRFRGLKYIATPTMAHHAETFFGRYELFRGFGIDIEIFGDGLLPAMIKARLETPPEAEKTVSTPPKPSTARAVDKLRVVTFKWKGHIAYDANDVNIWARMVDRWLDMPCELVCVTDDPEGIDGSIRIVPMWRDHFEHGRDWHRLKLFAPEMADIIGPRFACTDLDVVICNKLDPLFDHDAPFKAWRDPFRPRQYCTSVFQMNAGAFPHVLDTFDAEKALALRTSGKFSGYDQAWISEVLPSQPVWTPADGVLSFKRDILKADTLEAAHPSSTKLPAHARIINFHGKFNPRDADVQARLPWVAEFWN
jgi:hypothetical protein